MIVLKAVAALLPVVAFLALLRLMDSFKLVRLRMVVWAIGAGAAAAVLLLELHEWLATALPVSAPAFSRYVAPVTEETAKAVFVVVLLWRRRIGFLVDAAILGFAVGAGFAVAENLWFLGSRPDSRLAVWIIRGLGTAIMHGGATAICAILSRLLSERSSSPAIVVALPGLFGAVAVHSFFNHFFLSPVASALAVLVVLPPLVTVVFRTSERSLREWLDVGFDADTELLELIQSGELSESRVGRYLQTLRGRFRGEILADLLCYLRLRVELSLRAKGLLLAREAGFRPTVSPEVRDLLDEMAYLERSIGRTGKLALSPFLRTSDQDLWQLRLLGKN